MKDCVFCNIPARKYVMENEHFYVIPDKYPVSKGHHLIIAKRHVTDFFELDDAEASALLKMSQELREMLETAHHPTGYNLAMNCGKSAGQTIFHFHLHFIPRYP